MDRSGASCLVINYHQHLFLTILTGIIISVPTALYGDTFLVTNLNDSGDGSLRQAITSANANAVDDTISFNDGLSGDLNLSSMLPVFSDTGTTFDNGGGINLIFDAGSAGGHDITYATLKFQSDATISEALPGVSHITTGSYASVISSEDSLTLDSDLAGNISGNFGSGGSGVIVMDNINLQDGFSGSVEVTTTNNSAYGFRSVLESMTITNDLSGDVNVTSGTNAAYGFYIQKNITINGALSGTISSEAGTSVAYGLLARNDKILITNDLSGTVTARTGTSQAYGLSSSKDLTIGGDLSGIVLAEAGTRSAYGMNSNDNLKITGNLSGSVTATTGTDSAYGIRTVDDLTITGDLSGSVSATAGTDSAFGLFAIDNIVLGTGISGSVSAKAGDERAIGIYSLGTLSNNGVGGATNISGSVTAEAAGLAVAIGVEDGMNINVTGTVSATDTSGSGKAYAITSGRADTDLWRVNTTDNIDDTVTLGNGANVTGQIDLGDGTGTDTLSLDGSGTLNGAVSNITDMTKTGSGTWATTGRIDTGNLSVNAGTLSVDADTSHVVDGNFNVAAGTTVNAAIRQNSSPTITVTNTATINGSVNFQLETFIPTGTGYNAISSGGLVSTGTYTVDNPFMAVAASGNNITITKQAYADRSPNSSNAKDLVAALDAESNSATSGIAVLLTDLDQIATLAEFNDSIDELLPNEGFSSMSMDTVRLFALAVQTRMAGIRSNRNTIASGFNRQNILDPDDPSTWPLLAYAGDVTELFDRKPVDKDFPNALYLQALGKSGSLDSHDWYDGYDYETTGLTGGWDRILGRDFLAGINFGYAKNKVDYQDTGNSNADAENIILGLYGTWFRQNWHLEASLSGAYNKFNANRNITFLDSTAQSDAKGFTLAGKMDYSYRFAFGSTGISPHISTEYIQFHQDSYTETGADAANLSMDSLTNKSLQSGLGLKLDHRWKIGRATIIPEISTMWMHEFIDRDRQYNMTMSDAPGTVFSQTMAAAEEDSFRLGTGITVIHASGLSFSVQYQGEVEKHAESHSLFGELLWLF